MKTNNKLQHIKKGGLLLFVLLISISLSAQGPEKLAAVGRKLHQAPREKTTALESALTSSVASKQTSLVTLAQQQEAFKQVDQQYLKLSQQINPGSDPMASHQLISELEAAFASPALENETNSAVKADGWMIQTNAREWQLYTKPIDGAQTYQLEKSIDGQHFQRSKEKFRLEGHYWQTSLVNIRSNDRYFRIAAISANKKIIHTATIERKAPESSTSALFVNPSLVGKGILEIQVTSLPAGPYRLSITDSQRQEQAYFLFDLTTSTRSLQFPIAETMAPGLYQVNLSGQSVSCSQEFVK
ncbi:MAG TPA: hypothetical protein PKK69_02170 [Ferruginibacter sp.]|nr:hypothetical protein [Ferruginibacter sp.]